MCANQRVPHTIPPLVDALRQLDLSGEIDRTGRWLTIETTQCKVYVVESTLGHNYYTWCDNERARSVEQYPDPLAAIRAGLRRAEQLRGTQEQQEAS